MTLASLLAELARRGIRLQKDGYRLRYYPQSAMTTELAEQVSTKKAKLLRLMSSSYGEAMGLPKITFTEPLCPCGSTSSCDVPIHDGQSVRRDCAGCGRFVDFPVWYGKGTLQCAQ